MTLRKKLVTLIVSVVLFICAIMAVALTLFLRSNLSGQLDEELRAASSRAINRPSIASSLGIVVPQTPGAVSPSFGELPLGPTALEGRPTSDSPETRLPAGQAAGTIYVSYIRGYVLDAGYVDAHGEYQLLTQEQFEVLDAVTTDGNIHDVTVPSIGSYRAISDLNIYGDRVITAVSSASTDDAIRAFIGLESLLIVLAISGAGGIGLYVIHRSLRPLESVALTARRVSEMPLSQGEVRNLDRVPDSLTDESTEVGQVGAALNRMLGHVEQALEARHASEIQVRQFVADASHELRTPLASIRGYSELVRRSGEDLPPHADNALERIESESVRMTDLVEDLLLLAHLDSGRELATDPVDLSMLAVLTLSDAHAAGPMHTWKLEIPEEPCVVLGDEARLQQVLVNLLANARVHTPDGTEVTLSVEPMASCVTVTVTDNGPGIPQEVRPRLFQRFSRGDASRNRRGGSTGLGLAIAQAIVLAHHGTIEVSSQPGSTTFAVTLPLLTANSAQGASGRSQTPPVPQPPIESDDD